MESLKILLKSVDNVMKEGSQPAISWLSCSPIVYPTQVSLCPTLDTIKDRFYLDNLIITVYSLSGYNFSSEYTNVYKATYNKLNVYEDLSAVIRRTLKSLDPTMMEVFCLKYADYVIRTASWESNLAHSVAAETVKGLVSSKVTVTSKWKDTDFSHIKVYVGRSNGGELFFSVRVRVELTCTEEEVGSVDAVSGTKPTTAKETQPLEFVYYREFKLTNKALDEFDQAVFVKGSAKGVGFVPPPPPSRAKKGAETEEDIRLFLVVPSAAADTQPVPAVVAPEAVVLPADPTAHRSVEDTSDEEDDATAQLKKKKGAKGQNSPADEAEARVAVRPTKKCDASHCSEVVVWGFNSAGSMGVEGAAEGSEDRVLDPRSLAVPYSLAIERVSIIACSANHTLILTHLGAVYGCGDNTEGALGMRDLVSR